MKLLGWKSRRYKFQKSSGNLMKADTRITRVQSYQKLSKNSERGFILSVALIFKEMLASDKTDAESKFSQ